MKNFKVTIIEHVCETFDVEAETIEDAMEIAETKYNKCEFVLEPGEIISKLMYAEDEETEEITGTREF